MSFADVKKIVKSNGGTPSELEEQVAKALVELEITSKDLAVELRDLYITKAQEITIDNKKIIIIHIPFKLYKKYTRIQIRLLRELEKKFSGKHIVAVAQRTILSKSHTRRYPGTERPRNRTLTAVHSKLLDDIVSPTVIVGKRTKFSVDGKRLLKVYLDNKDQKDVEHKLKTYQAVYHTLTNKNVEFMFPSTA